MSEILNIKGQAFQKEIGPGAWGIVTQDGIEYRPVNMPEQLKHDGAEVTCAVIEIAEEISIHMWGIPVEIVSFHTKVK